MKKMSRYLIAAAFLLLSVSVLVSAPMDASASPVDQARGGATAAGAGQGPTLDSTVLTITNILVYIVGIAAVIMIIIGAIKYTTANGDEKAVTSAKNTIIYSVVGLILAIMAGGIVNFVLDQF